jgi:hypothetical protein
VQEQVQLDPELAAKVNEQLQSYIDKLKETENTELVNMAILNIQFENFRRTMMMSGAPPEIVAEHGRIMQTALDMIGYLIKVEELGTERFVAVRNDIIQRGDELTKAVLAE